MALINTTLTTRNLTVSSLNMQNNIITLVTTTAHNLGGSVPVTISGATGTFPSSPSFPALAFNGTFDFKVINTTTLTATTNYPTTLTATGTITASINNLTTSTIIGDGGRYYITVADGYNLGGGTLVIQSYNPDQITVSTQSVGMFIEPILINNGAVVDFSIQNATSATNICINVSR